MLIRCFNAAFRGGQMTLGLALLLTGLAGLALGGEPAVPEIDAGSLASAVALVSFGATLFAQRRRAK